MSKFICFVLSILCIFCANSQNCEQLQQSKTVYFGKSQNDVITFPISEYFLGDNLQFSLDSAVNGVNLTNVLNYVATSMIGTAQMSASDNFRLNSGDILVFSLGVFSNNPMVYISSMKTPDAKVVIQQSLQIKTQFQCYNILALDQSHGLLDCYSNEYDYFLFFDLNATNTTFQLGLASLNWDQSQRSLKKQYYFDLQGGKSKAIIYSYVATANQLFQGANSTLYVSEFYDGIFQKNAQVDVSKFKLPLLAINDIALVPETNTAFILANNFDLLVFDYSSTDIVTNLTQYQLNHSSYLIHYFEGNLFIQADTTLDQYAVRQHTLSFDSSYANLMNDQYIQLLSQKDFFIFKASSNQCALRVKNVLKDQNFVSRALTIKGLTVIDTGELFGQQNSHFQSIRLAKPSVTLQSIKIQNDTNFLITTNPKGCSFLFKLYFFPLDRQYDLFEDQQISSNSYLGTGNRVVNFSSNFQGLNIAYNFVNQTHSKFLKIKPLNLEYFLAPSYDQNYILEEKGSFYVVSASETLFKVQRCIQLPNTNQENYTCGFFSTNLTDPVQIFRDAIFMDNGHFSIILADKPSFNQQKLQKMTFFKGVTQPSVQTNSKDMFQSIQNIIVISRVVIVVQTYSITLLSLDDLTNRGVITQFQADDVVYLDQPRVQIVQKREGVLIIQTGYYLYFLKLQQYNLGYISKLENFYSIIDAQDFIFTTSGDNLLQIFKSKQAIVQYDNANLYNIVQTRKIPLTQNSIFKGSLTVSYNNDEIVAIRTSNDTSSFVNYFNTGMALSSILYSQEVTSSESRFQERSNDYFLESVNDVLVISRLYKDPKISFVANKLPEDQQLLNLEDLTYNCVSLSGHSFQETVSFITINPQLELNLPSENKSGLENNFKFQSASVNQAISFDIRLLSNSSVLNVSLDCAQCSSSVFFSGPLNLNSSVALPVLDDGDLLKDFKIVANLRYFLGKDYIVQYDSGSQFTYFNFSQIMQVNCKLLALNQTQRGNISSICKLDSVVNDYYGVFVTDVQTQASRLLGILPFYETEINQFAIFDKYYIVQLEQKMVIFQFVNQIFTVVQSIQNICQFGFFLDQNKNNQLAYISCDGQFLAIGIYQDYLVSIDYTLCENSRCLDMFADFGRPQFVLSQANQQYNFFLATENQLIYRFNTQIQVKQSLAHIVQLFNGLQGMALMMNSLKYDPETQKLTQILQNTTHRFLVSYLVDDNQTSEFTNFTNKVNQVIDGQQLETTTNYAPYHFVSGNQQNLLLSLQNNMLRTFFSSRNSSLQINGQSLQNDTLKFLVQGYITQIPISVPLIIVPPTPDSASNAWGWIVLGCVFGLLAAIIGIYWIFRSKLLKRGANANVSQETDQLIEDSYIINNSTGQHNNP